MVAMTGAQQSMFEDLLQRTPGLLAIVLSDRDGVVLEQVKLPSVSDSMLSSAFLSSMAIASEQASKLGLGRNKAVAAVYGDMQLVHFNMPPVIVALFATKEANTGVLLDLDRELHPLVDMLSPLLASVQNI